MELWDEETNATSIAIGIYTLPEMELPFDDMADIMAEIRRVTSAILEHDKFPIVLGGEHSITLADRRRGGREASRAVGAADRRARRSARHLHGHALQPRVRDAPRARVRALHAGGHPQPVDRRSEGGAGAADDDLLRRQHAAGHELDRSRWSTHLARTVYITIDSTEWIRRSCRPSGTPEPGGLSWHEMLALLRAVISARTVVGCDLVELCAVAGNGGAELPLREAGLQDSHVHNTVVR